MCRNLHKLFLKIVNKRIKNTKFYPPTLYIKHEQYYQSFKKTIEHKTVVFLGHMNDNSNFTFPITSTIPRRWPLQNYTEATVKENPEFHVFGNFGY